MLANLGVPLCREHASHLQAVGTEARKTLDDTSFAAYAILREAQGLMFPQGPGNLTLLESA